MAQPVQQQQRPSMAQVSVRSLTDFGLTEEDVRELQALNLGSIQAVMTAMDNSAGDLTQNSTAAVVIEREQSERIGNAVLFYLVAHGRKKNWVKNWQVSGLVVETVEAEESEPERTGVKAFLYGFWTGDAGN